MNFEKLTNYTKIKKMSEINNKLTDFQKNKINSIIIDFAKIEKLISINSEKINPNIFLMEIINVENQTSNLIEGTSTFFNELANDIEGINNVDAWETRNSISLYLDSIKEVENNIFFFSKEKIQEMHFKLFSENKKSKFKLMFDPQRRIDTIKPGKIIDNDKMPNWIGKKKIRNLNEAKLIPIKPSLKKEYLDDLFNFVELKIKTNSLTFEHIFAFHPIFESIHPFSDGNGRLGRLLLTLLFKKSNLFNILLINFSNEIYKERDFYISELENLNLTNDWARWNEYFLNLLEKVKDDLFIKITKIINLWKYDSQFLKIEKNQVRKKILGYFFKHYKLHKRIIIKKMVKNGVNEAKAYREFNFICKNLKIEQDGKYFSYEKIKDIFSFE